MPVRHKDAEPTPWKPYRGVLVNAEALRALSMQRVERGVGVRAQVVTSSSATRMLIGPVAGPVESPPALWPCL